MVAALLANEDKPSLFRTLLILGRVSNLPTVWSNCLAGWLIAGSTDWAVFVQICIGASLLYVGGMFLNDACDADFDRTHRSERPIPSGTISSETVWRLSYFTLGLGALVLVFAGRLLILPALGLLACIIFYDFIHKRTPHAPVIMAVCRFLLYLVAGAGATGQAATAVLWAATAMAIYIVGLSYIARREATSTQISGWPFPLLLMPVLISAIQGGSTAGLVVLWLLLLSWVLFALAALRVPSSQGGAGVAISRLLAGIVLVDMLTVPGASGIHLLAFALLFGSALLLQRTVPAT